MVDKEYLKLCQHILDNGITKEDRTGVGTRSVFGYQMRFNLSDGFPLLTTKKVNFNLVWSEFSKQYKEQMDIFKRRVLEDEEFSAKYGDLGNVYGKQWRDFNGIDQLKNVVEQIKTNPSSRRLIVSSWNPAEVDTMALPPCHSLFQFYVNDGKLSCQLYQRSGDVFLGVPFNIASYALLTILIAKECKLEVGEFIHTLGDAHIYSNHFEQVKEQMSREPYTLPTLNIKDFESIFDLNIEDVELNNYESHPFIKAPIAV